ncbi:PREDICTED: UBN2 domain-containing [Prunus dulcis]|uniref:PREDICTED: UBN2 domain-containing n=1 Tax=Prunus dulcis TaxID=3755 RepID=A0A5E4FH54_PRUDU|nr:PREDICTED: UBN2 domain-containing [Prunus dulcis]
MEEHVRGGIKKCDTTKEYLATISEKYQKSQKVETGKILSTFTTMKHDGTGSVREQMVDMANKLTSLQISINDEFIVHMALNSLTPEYEQIKVSYHTQKDKWSVNELISICCEQEDMLKKGKTMAVNLVDIVNRKKAGGSKKYGNHKFGGSKGGSTSKMNIDVEYCWCDDTRKEGKTKRDE